MKITLNGESKSIDKPYKSLLHLLKESDVQNPDLVSVQLNGQFVEKSLFESTNIKENDEIDFLYFMGGGAS